MTPPKKAQEELKLELAMARAEVEQMREAVGQFRRQMQIIGDAHGIHLAKLQEADYFTVEELEMYHKKGIVALLLFWQDALADLEGRRKVPQTRLEEMMQDAGDYGSSMLGMMSRWYDGKTRSVKATRTRQESESDKSLVNLFARILGTFKL
jgi:hypothetical protein